MPRASNADNRVTGLIEYTANGVPHFSMIALATSGGQQAHDCRSRTAAGVGHPDHTAAELERHQPPPGRGRDGWLVVETA